MTAVLRITDGTETINLLDPGGWMVSEWKPKAPETKGGGVYADNPMSDERRLVHYARQSIIDTFEMKARGMSQDSLIRIVSKLRAMLNRAADCWGYDWNTSPVWIEAKASCESEMRYAVVMRGEIPEDDSPFRAPFLQVDDSAAMDDLSLVVEHQIWRSQPPGRSSCVSLSTVQSYLEGANLVVNPGFEVLGGGGADVFASWNEVRIPATAPWFWLIADSAVVHAGAHACAIYSSPAGYEDYDQFLYQSFTVTPSEVITISFWTRGDGYMAGRYGLFASSAPPIYDPAYWLIPPTTTGVPGTTYTQVSFQYTVPADVVEISLALIGPPAEYGGADDIRPWYALFDDVSLTRAGQVSGLSENDPCSAWRYVVQKSITANITHIYVYDAAPAGWSANLFGSALPYALTPAAPAVGDIVYFGIEQAGGVNCPFSDIIFDVGTASVGLTFIWEWWNGAAWVTFSGTDYTASAPSAMSSSPSFSRLSFGSAAWNVTTTWTACNLLAVLGGGAPNITGYWVRARISAAAAPTAPQVRNVQPYCARNAWVDVPVGALDGDLPALCKAAIHNREYFTGAGGGTRTIERVMIGSRRLSRGESFAAFLNLDGTQNPSGVVAAFDASTHAQADVRSPTGQVVHYDPAGIEALTQHYTLTIPHPLSAQYRGRYRVFVTHRGATTDNSFQVRAALNGTVVWTGIEVHWFGGTSLFDSEVGILDLTFPGMPSGEFGPLVFQILFSSDSAAHDSYLQSLVLVPVDEWACDVMIYPDSIKGSSYLLADSAEALKADVRAVTLVEGTGQLDRKFQAVSNGSFALAPGQAHRIWFYFGLAAGAPGADVLASVELSAVNRYSTMRGAA